jgi:U1 small nuclear ribonucleoprotein
MTTLPAHYRTLFLGDLSSFCTEEDVHRFFQSCGEVERIRVMRGKELKPLGYGFVSFVTREAALRGKALDGAVFLGRPVK